MHRPLWTLGAALGVLLLSTPAARANGRLPATVNVDSYQGDFILLPSTFGLLLSTDGGDSFQWVCENNIGYGGTFDPDYEIAADGSIWATTFEGLRVSRDGACTWETQAGPLENRFIGDVEIGPDDRIWAGSATGGESNDVFVSSDDGATFSPAGLFDDVAWWRSVKVAPSDADRVYVSGFRLPQPDGMGGMTPAEALLRVTINGGTDWQTLAVDDFTFGSQPNLYMLGVHPGNPDIAFARVLGVREPVGDDVYRSADGGASWTNVLQLKDFVSAFTIRADGAVIVGTVGNCMGDDDELDKGCVRISTDDGATFQAPATEPKMACVTERNGELLSCGANWEPDNFALGRSTDGGQSWEKMFRFSELSGPLSCPESSPQFECAALDWPPLCIQLGICSATPDAGLDAGDVDPPKGNCLGCNAGGGVALGLIVLIPWARRRRR